MNTTALAVIQPDELETIQRTGKLLAASGYFDGQGSSPEAIAKMATKIMAGREIGIGPFASVNGIHIVKGKPSIGANLMASAVKQSGRYNYRVRELTDRVCSIEFLERNGDKWESVGISTFTAEDARKAGTQNMDKFPRNMLFARAMSNGVRWYTPDIFSGNTVYVPEELGAEVDSDGNVIDTTFTVTPQEGPHATQSVSVVDNEPPAQKSAQQPASAAQGDAGTDSNGDVLFDKDADGSPPHQRLWGIGSSVFGPAWKNGGRAWFLKFWSRHATPDNERGSLADFSDDEKSLIADYLEENRAKLQKAWRKYETDKANGAVVSGT